MTYADLVTRVAVNVSAPGTKHGLTAAHLTLFWCNCHPSEILLTAIHTDGRKETWRVGRSLFIAARIEGLRGAWAGGGDFAVCYREDAQRAMLAFKDWTTGKHTIVSGDLTTIAEFIAHTERLVPTGPEEEAINIANIDVALAKILEAGDE